MYYQVLVNKKHKYQEEMFKDRVLVKTVDVENEVVEVEEKTYKAYQALKTYLEKEKNLSIGILSSYRSLECQQEVHDSYLLQYGKEYTEKIVAPVGASEHHTGLCIDISIQKEGVFPTDNKEIMQDVEKYQSIVPYLSQFGFILRYKEGKEEITGYPYEPWHIRYVGEPLAKKLEEEKITLEEYYQNLSGVLVINKEKNMTSRDVVNLVSKYFYTKKVGHTGTLDPLATGVLIVTLGKATRIQEMLMATDKEYIAKVRIGLETDTLDITGEVVKEEKAPENLAVEETLKSFQKTYEQEVPIYSAVKIKGKKLYEYARNKEKVVLPKKEVTIQEIELLEQEKDFFSFRAVVSKGCYIRSLIRDIGESLGASLTMESLTRTKQGPFLLANTCSLESIKTGTSKMLSLKESLKNYPVLEVNQEEEKKVKNGAKLENKTKIEGPCVILDKEKQILAIYKGEKEDLVAWKVLTTKDD